MGADTIKIGAEIQFNAPAVARKYLLPEALKEMQANAVRLWRVTELTDLICIIFWLIQMLYFFFVYSFHYCSSSLLIRRTIRRSLSAS
jgi:hypothetical protein